MKLFLSLIALFSLGRSLSAAILFDDAVLLRPQAFGDYGLALQKSIPRGQGLFYVTFDAVDDETFQFRSQSNDYGIAEAFSIFVAPLGLKFDADYVASHTPLFTNAAPKAWSLSIPLDSTVTLAYWDNRYFGVPGPDPTDNYGWLFLRNSADGLSLERSVTALGGGIVVGTVNQLTAVPEPSTVPFGIFALALVAWCRTRHQHGTASAFPGE